jgi:hypothetical protein
MKLMFYLPFFLFSIILCDENGCGKLYKNADSSYPRAKIIKCDSGEITISEGIVLDFFIIFIIKVYFRQLVVIGQ